MNQITLLRGFRNSTSRIRDAKVGGITSFNLKNKETVASVMNTLANKAGLTQRGDGYVRKKTTAQTTNTHP